MGSAVRLPVFHSGGVARTPVNALNSTTAVYGPFNTFNSGGHLWGGYFDVVSVDSSGVASYNHDIAAMITSTIGYSGFIGAFGGMARVTDSCMAMPFRFSPSVFGAGQYGCGVAIASISNTDVAFGPALALYSESVAAYDGSVTKAALLPNGNILVAVVRPGAIWFYEVAFNGLMPTLVGSSSQPCSAPFPNPTLELRSLFDSVMVITNSQWWTARSATDIHGPGYLHPIGVSFSTYPIVAAVGLASSVFITIQREDFQYYDQTLYPDGTVSPPVIRSNAEPLGLRLYEPPTYGTANLFITGSRLAQVAGQPMTTQHYIAAGREATGYPVDVSNDPATPLGSGDHTDNPYNIVTLGSLALIRTESGVAYVIHMAAGLVAPVMRLNQRDDGLGATSGHARMISGQPNGAQSGQASTAPRIGTNNIYDPGY